MGLGSYEKECKKVQPYDRKMQYQDKKKALSLGREAIESAHKDVLQKRLKLYGQRWTKKGLQQVAQLRVACKSNQWNQITKLCQNAA